MISNPEKKNHENFEKFLKFGRRQIKENNKCISY